MRSARTTSAAGRRIFHDFVCRGGDSTLRGGLFLRQKSAPHSRRLKMRPPLSPNVCAAAGVAAEAGAAGSCAAAADAGTVRPRPGRCPYRASGAAGRRECRRHLVAQVAVFFQRLVDEVFELRRHVGIQADRRSRERGREWPERSAPKCLRETAAFRSPFRRARRRRKKDRCANPVLFPSPAPATCRRRCRESSRGW